MNITICVLTFGDYPLLARRVLDSIRKNCPRAEYRLIVGANAPGRETKSYLDELANFNEIDRLIVSQTNLSKCPMMRRMFDDIETDFVWWFDDDSYVTQPEAFYHWLKAAEEAPLETVMWGMLAVCDHSDEFAATCPDVTAFVRSAQWYRGLTPPSWRPGGKGEFNFEGSGTGDGRWCFALGGSWLIRTSAIRTLDWPDPRLVMTGEDVFLGEAIRQQGWRLCNLPNPGLIINDACRRADPNRHSGEFRA